MQHRNIFQIHICLIETHFRENQFFRLKLIRLIQLMWGGFKGIKTGDFRAFITDESLNVNLESELSPAGPAGEDDGKKLLL